MAAYLLGIDQGTTSSRAIIFSAQGQRLHTAQREFKQYFPHDGWVEHDPREIWQTTLDVCREVLQVSGLAAHQISAIGITNQRETTLVWDRVTDEPIYPAIVWQDRRTADQCEKMRHAKHEGLVVERTGLLIDPYFSASKIAWILDHVTDARARAARGELAFGTVDTWILWKLTGGKSHCTDASNASRTALFNIHTQAWDADLLRLFNIPVQLLPEVKDSAAEFGETLPIWLDGKVPIRAMAGDQQAALFGQACFQRGMAKSTYGTGCFLMLNTGDQVVRSENRLLSTVAYRLQGQTTYAVEGSIFVAGAAIQWLRDGLGLVKTASETTAMAEKIGADNSVYMVPAFTGLGAPYWDPHARGALFGLTRDTGIAEIVTAGLQAVCYQTKDLVRAIQNDGVRLSGLRVDGGMVGNDWLVQFLADMLNVPVDRPQVTETTAFGVAYLAGLQSGIYQDLDEIAEQWACQQRFSPQMRPAQRERLYHGWLDAVERVRRH
ncbi:MAG: glycerol kinase GlpK [Pseudomonadota bacterium]|nr:glycerol kinase GlpK [Pseudomonadota bacterium]